MPTLVASYGLPRSGKSTILRQLSEKYGAPIVSRDAIRLALHGHIYASNAEDFTRSIYKVMIRSLFGAGHELVLADETHWSQAARDFIKSPDWDTQFITIHTPPDTCKERAIATDQPWLLEVIDQMMERVEPLSETDKPVEYRYNPAILRIDGPNDWLP